MWKRVVFLASAVLVAGIVVAAARSLLAGRLPAPAGNTVTRQTWRASLPRQFPDVGAALDFTPDEARDFFDLLAKQQRDLWHDSVDLVTGEAKAAGTAQPLQHKLVEQLRANEAELTAKLGNKYARWQDYQDALIVRRQVESLQSRLAAGRHVLAPAQVQPLIAALAAEQSRLDRQLHEWDMSPTAADSPDMLDEHMRRRAEDQRSLLRIASPHLDAAQQEEFRLVLDQARVREAALIRVVGELGTAPVQTMPGAGSDTSR